MFHPKLSLSVLLFIVLSLSSRHLTTTEAFNEINVRSAATVDPKSSLGNEALYRMNSMHKEKMARKSRKLLEDLVQLDYDYAGPNPKHDPRKGRGGRSL